jgi:hypothetical protein
VAQERRERDSQLLSRGDKRERGLIVSSCVILLLVDTIVSCTVKERAKRKCTALMNGELGIDRCGSWYQPYLFSEVTVFFSHNKSANNIFAFQQSEQGPL